MITGQLILMDKGPATFPDRKIVMVIGILAMPTADAERFCSDDQLRTVVGTYLGQDVKLALTDDLTPMPDYVRGADASTMLESEMWRV
jgi:hypothetical protein